MYGIFELSVYSVALPTGHKGGVADASGTAIELVVTLAVSVDDLTSDIVCDVLVWCRVCPSDSRGVELVSVVLRLSVEVAVVVSDVRDV